MTDFRKLCPTCGRVFTHPPALTVHMKSCAGSKKAGGSGHGAKNPKSPRKAKPQPPSDALSLELPEDQAENSRAPAAGADAAAVSPGSGRSGRPRRGAFEAAVSKTFNESAISARALEAAKAEQEAREEEEEKRRIRAAESQRLGASDDPDADMARQLQRELNGFRGCSPRRRTYNPVQESSKPQWKLAQKQGLWQKEAGVDENGDPDEAEAEEEAPHEIRVGDNYQATSLPKLRPPPELSQPLPPSQSRKSGTIVWSPAGLDPSEGALLNAYLSCLDSPAPVFPAGPAPPAAASKVLLESSANSLGGVAGKPGAPTESSVADDDLQLKLPLGVRQQVYPAGSPTSAIRLAMAHIARPTYASELALGELYRHDYDFQSAQASLEALAHPRGVTIGAPVGGVAGVDGMRRFEAAIEQHGKNFRRVLAAMNRRPDGEATQRIKPGPGSAVSMAGLTLFYYSQWKHTKAHKEWHDRWQVRSRDRCEVCGKGGRLLCCALCPASYHPRCTGFVSYDAAVAELGAKGGGWACRVCKPPPSSPPITPMTSAPTTKKDKDSEVTPKTGKPKQVAWKSPQDLVGKRVRDDHGRTGKVLSTSHGFFSVQLDGGETVNLRGAVLSLHEPPKRKRKPQSADAAADDGDLSCSRCGRVFSHPPALAVHRKACSGVAGKHGGGGGSSSSSPPLRGDSARPWTEAEDARLLQLVRLGGTGNWADKAQELGAGRSASAVGHRWHKLGRKITGGGAVSGHGGGTIGEGATDSGAAAADHLYGVAAHEYGGGGVGRGASPRRQAAAAGAMSGGGGSGAPSPRGRARGGADSPGGRPSPRKRPRLEEGWPVAVSTSSRSYSKSCPKCNRTFNHPPALAVHIKSCGESGTEAGDRSPRGQQSSTGASAPSKADELSPLGVPTMPAETQLSLEAAQDSSESTKPSAVVPMETDDEATLQQPVTAELRRDSMSIDDSTTVAREVTDFLVSQLVVKQEEQQQQDFLCQAC